MGTCRALASPPMLIPFGLTRYYFMETTGVLGTSQKTHRRWALP